MVEIDTKAEITTLAGEMEALALQLQDLEKKSQALKNEIVKRQGAIEVLKRLDGNKAK